MTTARYATSNLRDSAHKLSAPVLRSLKRRRLGTLDRYTVYSVDGKAVRENVDIDFTAGGNPCRYGYVPKGELWVEGKPNEYGAVALHEFVEATLMSIGMTYNKAHAIACEEEKKFRAAFPRGTSLKDAKIWQGRAS